MTRETLKNTAKNAAETARAAGADALKKARDEAAEVVTTAAQAIRAEAEARADEGKAQISREGLRLTDALKERAATADYELERRVLDAVASGVAEMSQGLRTRSVSSIIEDTERFARNHPGAFVAGAAAAMLSKNGAVSYVGGLEIPSIVNAGAEFGNGARYINPDIKYFENYTGDFDDVAKSKEATLAAIAQGADVHYHILNLGLRGMEQAAKEKGTHIIGSYTDYCGTDPLYVAYSITGVGYQVQYAIDQAVAGTWEAGYKPFGLAMGPQASDMIVCEGTPEMAEKLANAV